MIRATIEEHCPPGVLMSEDEVNGHYGPELFAEAEAISAAIVKTRREAFQMTKLSELGPRFTFTAHDQPGAPAGSVSV
jgi:hypothetical protein